MKSQSLINHVFDKTVESLTQGVELRDVKYANDRGLAEQKIGQLQEDITNPSEQERDEGGRFMEKEVETENPDIDELVRYGTELAEKAHEYRRDEEVGFSLREAAAVERGVRNGIEAAIEDPGVEGSNADIPQYEPGKVGDGLTTYEEEQATQ